MVPALSIRPATAVVDRLSQRKSLGGNQALRAAPQLERRRGQDATDRTTIEARQKQWEKLPLNANGKPIRRKMHVHTGDTVQVVNGKDKGHVGEILKVYRKVGKVVVRDANLKTRFEKGTKEESGRIYRQEGMIDHSNVMLYSSQHQCRSRVGHKTNDQGRKVRFLVKTGEELGD